MERAVGGGGGGGGRVADARQGPVAVDTVYVTGRALRQQSDAITGPLVTARRLTTRRRLSQRHLLHRIHRSEMIRIYLA